MPKQQTSTPSRLADVLFEEAGVGLCLVGPDGTVLRVNSEWLRSTGFALEQVIGEDIIELFPDARDMAVAMHASARRGDTVFVPPHQLHIFGRPTWWEGRISPIPMDGGTGLLITAREMTDQVARDVGAAHRPRQVTGSEVTPRGPRDAPEPSAVGPAEEEPVARAPLAAGSMRARLSSPASRYAVAAVVTIIAFLLRMGLSRYFGPPYILFYPAVILAAALGGLGPGLLASAMSGVFAALWIIPAERQLQPMTTRDVVSLLAFTTVGVLMSVMAGRYRQARHRLVEHEKERAVRDATRDAHEQLKRSEAILAQASKLAQVGAWWLDLANPEGVDANRLCWSDEVYRIFGYSPREVEVTNDLFFERVHPEDRQRIREAVARAIAEKRPYVLEHRVLRPDGAERIVLEHAEIVFGDEGVPLRIVGAVQDITERKQAEQALRESDKRWRQLADSMPQIIWASRPDGFLDYYNRKWYELTGADECAHGDQSWLPILHPDDRQPCLDVWYESVRTGKPYQIEYRFKFPSTGEYRWHLGRALPVRDDDGNIVRWFGTCTDIHDQKLAAEASKEADRRKSEFLAVLSHELRNPLAPIRNSLYLLARAPPGSDQATRAKAVISRQTDHLARLVDDLLDVTRISRGKITLNRAHIDAREVVRKTCEDHRAFFDQRGVTLEVAAPAGPVWIDGDGTRFAQVVGNLLQNAAKFTPDGGSTRVTVTTVDGRAEIRVMDDGIGIEPELLERMFEPFAQAERGLARTQGGLGLGLALVKGLVELHGGSVTARSDGAHRGSEFTVSLPLAAPAERRANGADSSSAARPLDILVIEDNVDAGQTLVEVLEMSGHRVRLEHNGRAGITKAIEVKPDVVLCDIGLPDMDGYEVARTLRADDVLRPTYLVALSGYAQPEDKQRAVEAGFDAHLGKPAPLDELHTLLANKDKRRP